jgi:uncharacterized protein (DUF1015 family)
MARVERFQAVRPAPERAAAVASVPYDVVDTEEARALAAGNPWSFLHVIRPEIDLSPEIDVHAPEVYAQAGRAYHALLDQGALQRDGEPALFLYRQIMGGHAQTGFMAVCAVDEYDDDTIKKHEKTRPDKEDDRVAHVLAVAAHDEPVFLAYRDEPVLDALLAQGSAGAPLYDFTAPDGVRHTVWKAPDPGAIERAFLPVPALYVADGHHRSAAASRARAQVRDERRARDEGGAGEHDRFLAVVFPAGQLQILPYHRVVHDLHGHTAETLRAQLAAVGALRDGGPAPSGRGRVSVYLDGRWHEWQAPPSALDNPDPVASLDAAILQDLVLAPLLGIDNPRTSPRIDFVGGIRGPQELVRRVEKRGTGVAFALHPVSMEQLMAVADAGLVLPPKSTWFEPKLRSGLAIHEM